MPIKVAPPQLVTGIARTPLPYGLFSAVQSRPDNERFEGGGVTWEVDTYETLQGISAPFWDQDPTVGLPKDLTANRLAAGIGLPFTVYGNFKCSPVGWTPEAATAAATRALIGREEHRVEQALWTGDLINDPNFDAAPTVIDATARPIARLIGSLEKYIGDVYGTQGMIHLTRQAATMGLTSGALVTQGGRLMTALGTPVVAGSGYPGTGSAGSAPAANTVFAFASPTIFMYRSEVFTSTNRSGDLVAKTTNDLHAVAERTYVLGFDPAGVGLALLDLSGGA